EDVKDLNRGGKEILGNYFLKLLLVQPSSTCIQHAEIVDVEQGSMVAAKSKGPAQMVMHKSYAGDEAISYFKRQRCNHNVRQI
ncbi:14603_t:CDS:1, partial [Cetraspora pellucida]